MRNAVVSAMFTIVEGWNIRDLRAALAKVDGLEHDSAGWTVPH